MTTLCRVLEGSVSGYYAWCKRVPSQHSREDAHLAEQVKSALQANPGVSGRPRVHAELQAQGISGARTGTGGAHTAPAPHHHAQRSKRTASSQAAAT